MPLLLSHAGLDVEEFVEQFPKFQLEDELLHGGRDVMWGQTFDRRRKHWEDQGAKVQS
jgi:hypothetical protein